MSNQITYGTRGNTREMALAALGRILDENNIDPSKDNISYFRIYLTNDESGADYCWCAKVEIKY